MKFDKPNPYPNCYSPIGAVATVDGGKTWTGLDGSEMASFGRRTRDLACALRPSTSIMDTPAERDCTAGAMPWKAKVLTERASCGSERSEMELVSAKVIHCMPNGPRARGKLRSRTAIASRVWVRINLGAERSSIYFQVFSEVPW